MYHRITITFKAEDVETVEALESVISSIAPFMVDNVEVEVENV